MAQSLKGQSGESLARAVSAALNTARNFRFSFTNAEGVYITTDSYALAAALPNPAAPAPFAESFYLVRFENAEGDLEHSEEVWEARNAAQAIDAARHLAESQGVALGALSPKAYGPFTLQEA